MAKQKTDKVGVRVKYQKVVVPTIVRKESREFLEIGQYIHMTDLIKQLSGFGRREYESELRIEKFHEFWELKDKGGVLGRKNVRIYFSHEQDINEIVVLHAHKKEADGKPSPNMRFRLRNRLRLYRSGELKDGLVSYEKKPNE